MCSGPGSPGELFVEGEKFNIHRFYQNLNVVPDIASGRLYSPDVPFDPFGAGTSWRRCRPVNSPSLRA